MVLQIFTLRHDFAIGQLQNVNCKINKNVSHKHSLQNKKASSVWMRFLLWWGILNQNRTAITNHAYGVYIIKTKFCISPTQRVVYHQVAQEYTLKRDDLQPKRLMISTTLRAVMIYQVCDLDNKKPHPFG